MNEGYATFNRRAQPRAEGALLSLTQSPANDVVGEIDPVNQTLTSPKPAEKSAWYAGVSRYAWVVLAIASAGWVFDAFEGQVFNLTRNQLLSDLLNLAGQEPVARGQAIKYYGD